jgi:hypothetical protein
VIFRGERLLRYAHPAGSLRLAVSLCSALPACDDGDQLKLPVRDAKGLDEVSHITRFVECHVRSLVSGDHSLYLSITCHEFKHPNLNLTHMPCGAVLRTVSNACILRRLCP